MGIAWDVADPSTVVTADEPRVLQVGPYANLRDVGGYPTHDGRTTRWRTLLRGDLPATARTADVHTLTDLGVGLVLDLRDPAEHTEVPSPYRAAGLDVAEVPLFSGSAESFVADGVTLADLYRHLLDERAAQLTTAVRTIARATTPVLVHCTAGKDRTGLTVALALAAVGVTRATVVDDYALTARLLAGDWLARRIAELEAHHGQPLGDRAELLAGSPPHVLDDALAAVERRWGSVHGYLVAHGATPVELSALRARLTQPSDPARDTASSPAGGRVDA